MKKLRLRPISEKELSALSYATEKHKDQKRKYTGEPYINHCKEVADTLSFYEKDEDVICAAFLHDTVEDTDATIEEIKNLFGENVARLVEEVTDVSKPGDGNRFIRKNIDLEHISKASPQGKSIKLSDIMSNTASIIKHDYNFAETYLTEVENLLKVLSQGNEDLYRIASENCMSSIEWLSRDKAIREAYKNRSKRK